MLPKFLRRTKPRVFLGVIAVVPRTDLKRHLEQEGLLEHESLDSALRRHLTEIISLPPADRVEGPLPTDLVLDVLIPPGGACFVRGHLNDEIWNTCCIRPVPNCW